MAEGVGFEPTDTYASLDFESSALNRAQPTLLLVCLSAGGTLAKSLQGSSSCNLQLEILGSVRESVHVKAISYTAARETLAATMRSVCDDREPIIITRKREQPVVMMSLDDFESMQETNYLRRSPVNAERLNQAIEQLEAGQGVERELPEVK